MHGHPDVGRLSLTGKRRHCAPRDDPLAAAPALSPQAAHHRIRGAWLRYLARKRCDKLRELRAEALILMMKKVDTTKVGRRFGLRTSFNAPGTKTSTMCCDKNGAVLGQPKGHKRVIHPDIPWLVRGLTVFYNEYNPECLKNVKQIALASQGRSQQLREKMMAKYPQAPRYAFDWMLKPPSLAGVAADPSSEGTNSPVSASLIMSAASHLKLTTGSGESNNSSLSSLSGAPVSNATLQSPPLHKPKRNRAQTSVTFSSTQHQQAQKTPPGPSGRLASTPHTQPFALRLTSPQVGSSPSIKSPRTPLAFIGTLLNKKNSPDFGDGFRCETPENGSEVAMLSATQPLIDASS